MIIQAAIFSLLMAILPKTDTSQIGSIQVQFSGVDNIDGYIELSIFNGERGFPTTQQSVLKNYRIKVNQINPIYEINDLPYGEYAISCFWDKNNNQKLDTNFFGIPKEKVGTSNNPDKGSIPNYKDAKIILRTSELKLSIQMG